MDEKACPHCGIQSALNQMGVCAACEIELQEAEAQEAAARQEEEDAHSHNNRRDEFDW